MNTSLTIRRIDMTNRKTADYLSALDVFIIDMMFVNMPFEGADKYIPTGNLFRLYMKYALRK